MAVQSLNVDSKNYHSNWVKGGDTSFVSMNPVSQWQTMNENPVESANRINLRIANFNSEIIKDNYKKAFTNRKAHLILVGIGLSLAAPAFVSLVASQVPSLALLINQVATPYLLLGWVASASLIGLGTLKAILASLRALAAAARNENGLEAKGISEQVNSFYKSLEGNEAYRGKCTVMNYLEGEGRTIKGSKCRHFIPAFTVYSFDGGNCNDANIANIANWKFNPINIKSESIEGTSDLLNGCRIPLNQEACEKAAAEWEALSEEIELLLTKDIGLLLTEDIELLLTDPMELGGLREVIRASVTREDGDFQRSIRVNDKYDTYYFHKHSYEISFSRHSTRLEEKRNFTASELRDFLKESYPQLKNLRSSQEMEELVQVEA